MAILPESDPANAVRTAQRLSQCVETRPFAEAVHLTISLSVTSFRSGDTPDTLLKRVDNALQEAKRAGRNRVMVDREDPCSQAPVRGTMP